MHLSTTSTLFISRDGGSTTSLGSQCQCLTTPSETKSFLISNLTLPHKHPHSELICCLALCSPLLSNFPPESSTVLQGKTNPYPHTASFPFWSHNSVVLRSEHRRVLIPLFPKQGFVRVLRTSLSLSWIITFCTFQSNHLLFKKKQKTQNSKISQHCL